MTENNVFVPNDTFGDRKSTAVALTGAADEYGISQRAVKTTPRGFDITEELAALVFESDDAQSEADLLATEDAEREERDRLAAEQEAEERERLEREEAERLAQEQADAEALAAQEQAEADRLAAEQAEAEATKNKESTKGSKKASGNRAAK